MNRWAFAIVAFAWAGLASAEEDAVVTLDAATFIPVGPRIRAEVIPAGETIRPMIARPDRNVGDSLTQVDLGSVRRAGAEAAGNALQEATPVERRSADVAVSWVPPNQRHLPVYLEDVAVERYGQTISPIAQPVISGGRFLAQATLLPYQMGVDAPRRLQYDVGYARPGSPAPAVREHLPLSLRGVVYQGAASTGLLFFVHP